MVTLNVVESMLCPRKHDIEVVGRYGSGRCKQCTKDDARQRERDGLRTPMTVASKVKARAREKAWREERPGYGAAANRKYRGTPKGKTTNYKNSRAWRLANRVHSNQLHMARMRKAPALSKETIEQLLDYYGPNCVYCGGEASGFDHLQPVSKDGENIAENLAPCCQSCNSTKHNLPIWTMVA